ncbi:hypothetical protein DN068_03740 [Taibaiella soli]|uniref:Uncharacterized protein n=2 Tax=Taibaiella soli TaxID=1649169 RepID=A0A2W2BL30_9BACT|nr:hypothetical protein DN068_03740 [Taibaiella soli]
MSLAQNDLDDHSVPWNELLKTPLSCRVVYDDATINGIAQLEYTAFATRLLINDNAGGKIEIKPGDHQLKRLVLYQSGDSLVLVRATATARQLSRMLYEGKLSLYDNNFSFDHCSVGAYTSIRPVYLKLPEAPIFYTRSFKGYRKELVKLINNVYGIHLNAIAFNSLQEIIAYLSQADGARS